MARNAETASESPAAETTNTRPLAKVADAVALPGKVAVHTGLHVVGAPEQPLEPAASNANSCASWVATNTRPPETAGEAVTGPPRSPDVQSGAHVFGVPEHPTAPVASNA